MRPEGEGTSIVYTAALRLPVEASLPGDEEYVVPAALHDSCADPLPCQLHSVQRGNRVQSAFRCVHVALSFKAGAQPGIRLGTRTEEKLNGPPPELLL
ncbi:hypothetical protein OPV22_004623 [Ensete ventricosum]|uniref:Uncharacterized protein n=1 Tax=Ensete ventricosum TaxID=4639 RepID=A0AAV8Q6X8_ENSVE|nr:hypothetical protein OPV22_004623 [Ensete ventricosum]